MEGPIFYRGPLRAIEAAVLRDESMPAKDFVESCGAPDQAKLYALFKMLGDAGRIPNQEKFKKIEGSDFFEFKSFQLRLPCFTLPGGRVIITHGFKKKKDRIPAAEIARAERIRAEHLEREKRA